jgi:phospholipid/cholesterol/gamma-HCH transport system substrate-binding protein
MKKAQRIRLGIFILVSLTLLLVLIGFFTARQIFEKKDSYYVAYSDVSIGGLEVGSPVKFLGINVGSISEIYIDPTDVNTVIVGLSLREDTPVKEDAVADLVSMGITGLKIIEIRGGTQEAEFLPPGSFISQGTSLADDITGKAEVIAFKVEQVLNNLALFTHPDNLNKITFTVDRIAALADSARHTLSLVAVMLEDNRTDIRQTVQTSRQISQQLEQTSVEFHQAVAQVNHIMQGDTIRQMLGNLRDVSLSLKETDLNALIENLATATLQTQELLLQIGSDIDRGGETLTQSLMLLQNTLLNLNEASRKINTDPSLLIRGRNTQGTPDRLLKGN